MDTKLTGLTRVGGALALLALPATAQAQKIARVREVVQVVKMSRAGSAQLVDAEINTPLNPGDRVRTAGRSGAGIRFPDNSILRMGELTEVVVTSPDRRLTRVNRGQVWAAYKAPGVITGGYAVAAVRGTHILYAVDEQNKTALVRCYEGRVFVGASDNPVRAGTTTTLTPTTITDPDLVDADSVTIGGQIRFVDGPYVGQTRQITAFNAGAGTVTFAPALGAASGDTAVPSGYLLVAKPNRSVVQLLNNQGTTIGAGMDPIPAYRVANEAFAGGQRQPFFKRVADTGGHAGAGQVYEGSTTHQDVQDQNFGVHDAIETTVTGDIQTPGAPPDDPDCIFVPFSQGRFGQMKRSLASGFRRVALMQTARTEGGRPMGRFPNRTSPVTEGDEYSPAMVSPVSTSSESDRAGFFFEPFGIVSNSTDVLGSRIRFHGTSGNAYAELGYRYSLIDGKSKHDLSEGFIQFRGKLGDLTAGRQHFFFRLANNTNIGNLLGLETTDAIVYEAPLKNGFRQAAGYLFDTDPLGSSGFVGPNAGSFHGGFLRGQAPVGRGLVGYSLLAPTKRGSNLGWSVDAAQSVLPKTLDLYGEIGNDPSGRNIATAGFYLPGLYQRTHFDVFVEYAKRQGIDERVSLRVRRELGHGFLAVAFLDNELGGRVLGGGGFVWQLKFK